MCFCVDPEDGRIVKDTSVNALFGEPRCGDTGKRVQQIIPHILVKEYQY